MVILAMSIRPYAARRMGFNLGRLAPGLVLGLIAFIIVMPWILWLGQAVEWIIARFKLQVETKHVVFQMWDTASPAFKTLALITAILIAPIFEEFIFRGLIQTLLMRLFQSRQRLAAHVPSSTPASTTPAPDFLGLGNVPSPLAPTILAYQPKSTEPLPPQAGHIWAAVILTSIPFAAMHLPATRPMIFLLSLALGYVYERTANLWAAIGLHIIFNGANTLLFLLLGRH